jgi:lambda family phage tail tape measure protein
MSNLNYQAAIEINAQYTGQAAAAQANKDLNSLANTSKSLNQTLQSLVKGGLAGLAAAFTIEKIAEASLQLIEFGHSLEILSQKTGIGIQTLSDLKTAAEKTGVSFEGMDTSLKKFGSTLAAAQAGNVKAQAGFRAIGFSVDQIKSFQSVDEALLAVADKFKNTADGADKLKVAALLGQKGFADLIPLLNKGSEGIEGVGVKISEDFVKESTRFNENMIEMKKSSEEFGISILEYVLPTINSMVEKFRQAKKDLVASDFWKSVQSGASKALNTTPNFPLANSPFPLEPLVVPEITLGDKAAKKTNKIDTRFLGDPDKYRSERDAVQKLKDELAGLQKSYLLEADAINMTTSEYEKKKIQIEETTKAEKEVEKFQSADLKNAYLNTTKEIIAQKQALVDLKDAQKASFGVGIKQGLKEYTESIADVASQSKKLFTDAFKGIEDALVKFAQTGKLNFADLANAIEADLLRIAVRQAIIAPLLGLAGSFFSPTAGLAGNSAGGGLSSAVYSANGNIMTSHGPLALNRYASGGIANSPQFSIFGEGRTPEAYVPLPDGRSIPVSMKGGSGTNVVVNVNIGDGGGSDTTSSSSTQKGRQLGSLISSAVIQEIIKQKRAGGLLSNT